MNLEFFSAVDCGRQRSNNEDSVAVEPAFGLAVLADGMGGYNAGEVASAMATSIVARELVERLPGLSVSGDEGSLRDAVTHAVESANRRIQDRAAAEPCCAGMATTIVVALFRAGGLLLAHAGDSRGYRWRSGCLERLSHDHSLLQEQIDAGLVDAVDAVHAVAKNLVTRAVGVDPAVALEMHWHPLEAGDRVLLCSDGLTDMLDDGRLQRLLGAAAPLEAVGRSLVDAANAAGGHDNIAVVLTQVSGAAAARLG